MNNSKVDGCSIPQIGGNNLKIQDYDTFKTIEVSIRYHSIEGFDHQIELIRSIVQNKLNEDSPIVKPVKPARNID